MIIKSLKSYLFFKKKKVADNKKNLINSYIYPFLDDLFLNVQATRVFDCFLG